MNAYNAVNFLISLAVKINIGHLQVGKGLQDFSFLQS